MHITQLGLTNFRGIKRLELEFQPGINVIAGRNGVGKSGILRSMAFLLSHITSEAGRTSARSRRYFESDDINIDSDYLQADLICDVGDVPFRITLPKNREQLAVHRDDGRKSYSSEDVSHDEVILRDEPRFALLPNPHLSDWDVFKGTDKEEPFLAVYYGTNRSYLRQIAPSSGRTKLNGYDGALREDFIDLGEFGGWLNFITVIAPSDYSNQLNKHFQEAITRFLPEFSNLRSEIYDVNRGGRAATRLKLFVDKDGKKFSLQQLSDGERSILAIVLDLTRRLSLTHRRSLNPLKEGRAVVLIDEIDLHLHPIWQREILERLELVFPLCQFIVTTHSPQVIGQTPAEKVIYLQQKQGEIIEKDVEEAFGRDTNWILREIMGTPERDKETMEEIEELFQMIEQGNLETARSKIVELRERIGEDAELVAATTRIRRREILRQNK